MIARRALAPRLLPPTCVLVILLFNFSEASAAAELTPTSTSNVPDVGTILVRMARTREDNLAQLRPYVVKRRYRIFDGGDKAPNSQVIAVVTFIPPSTKAYVIQQGTGARLGQRIVRGILQAETQAAKDFALTDFTLANYDFRFLKEELHDDVYRVFVLELLPKRQEKNLIQGKVWIDADTYRVNRVEGKPAKGTSWLVKDVRLVLRYGDVEGMWLHTGTEATAKVRFLGPHSMISEDVEYDISKSNDSKP